MCSLDGVQRSSYFVGEPIKRAEVEVIMGRLKNEKTAGKDKITGEMVKGGVHMVGRPKLEAVQDNL